MILCNGTVLPMDAPVIVNGYVQFNDGKILSVGSMENCPADTERIDVHGSFILPGLVDAHCHVGCFGSGIGEESEDGNEISDPAVPQLRVLDAVNPLDPYFREAREAGVTTVIISPGSANPIAGQICALKTAGTVVDEMLVKHPLAMKLALGENPKMVYRDRDDSPTTRMGTAAIIREQLAKTEEYIRKQERAEEDPDNDAPDYDAKLEALVPVLKKEIPVHIHAHRADDIATGIRIAKEFDLDYILIHGTEGYLIADYLKKCGARVVTGPLLTDRSKPELSNQTLKNPVRLAEAGIQTAICTDHPEIPIPYLILSAGMAVKAGMKPETALRAVTLTAAEIAGIADRVGSLTPGKDADIVVYDGDPLALASKVAAVYIDGKPIKTEE